MFSFMSECGQSWSSCVSGQSGELCGPQEDMKIKTSSVSSAHMTDHLLTSGVHLVHLSVPTGEGHGTTFTTTHRKCSGTDRKCKDQLAAWLNSVKVKVERRKT